MKEPFRENLLLFLVSWSVAVFSGCDEGLAPEPPPQYGIGGTVYFTNWPPPNSVRDLRVVAFKDYPQGDIVAEVLAGKARFTPTLLQAYGTALISYELLLAPLPPGLYEYIAVAQQYGPNVFTDWRPVGLFEERTDTVRQPLVLFVPANEILMGVDIYVDFNDPPPQP